MIIDTNKRVYLACGSTDLRKSINGLYECVKSILELDPFSDAYFCFCNRSKDLIKCLEWDRDGFWLHIKRLERGHFIWPANLSEAKAMDMTAQDLQAMIATNAIALKFRRKDVTTRIFR